MGSVGSSRRFSVSSDRWVLKNLGLQLYKLAVSISEIQEMKAIQNVAAKRRRDRENKKRVGLVVSRARKMGYRSSDGLMTSFLFPFRMYELRALTSQEYEGVKN